MDTFAELKKIVNGYTMSQTAKNLLQEIPVMLLVSVTAGGKNTLIHELLKTGKYYYTVSHTTRQPRVNKDNEEKNGREYWFITEPEMTSKLEHGEMIEAKVVHETYVSGTSIEEFKIAMDQKKTVLGEIEVKGVEEFLKNKPDTLAVFILPPDFETWMERLMARASETTDQLHARMRSAQMELETALNTPRYYFVVNDELSEATKQLQDIADGNWSEDQNTTGKEVAWQLLNQIKRELQS